MPEINKQRAPLVHLSNVIAGLSEAASRVGQYILANPEKVVRQTVAELAEFTHSGQASVVRLCRQLGFNGFSVGCDQPTVFDREGQRQRPKS